MGTFFVSTEQTRMDWKRNENYAIIINKKTPLKHEWRTLVKCWKLWDTFFPPCRSLFIILTCSDFATFIYSFFSLSDDVFWIFHFSYCYSWVSLLLIFFRREQISMKSITKAGKSVAIYEWLQVTMKVLRNLWNSVNIWQMCFGNNLETEIFK